MSLCLKLSLQVLQLPDKSGQLQLYKLCRTYYIIIYILLTIKTCLQSSLLSLFKRGRYEYLVINHH